MSRSAVNAKTWRKASHFILCQDPNCERKWCVDRRNAPCKGEDCEIPERSRDNRCRWCHTQYFCSSYGWCDIHGEHGP